MATSAYMSGRKGYLKGAGRPQAILLSNNAGTLQSGQYIPNGVEGTDFIILTDGNRLSKGLNQNKEWSTET